MTALRNRKRRYRLSDEDAPSPAPTSTAWAHLIKALTDRACQRPTCKNIFKIRGNEQKPYCSNSCRDKHWYAANKPDTEIKQCAVPGCGNTFPNRMGGPLYCDDCREIVQKEQQRQSELKNRERNRPKRAAQQAALRAAWSPEIHARENAQICERAKERNAAKKLARLAEEWECECGKVYHKKHGNEEYCGDDCPVKIARKKEGWENWYRKNNPFPMKPCEMCGKQFHDKNGRGRVCPDCREEFEREQNKIRCKKRRKPKAAKCKYCKDIFQHRKMGPPPMACPKPKCQEAHKKHKNAQALLRQIRYAAKQRRKGK